MNSIHWSTGNKEVIPGTNMTGMHRPKSNKVKTQKENWKILQTKKKM